MSQARVFISCGQRPEARETEVAAAVSTALADEGFSPYVAVGQQTLQGLKENIFEKIEEAEYFVFIDFCREQIVGLAPPNNHRGSVFVQQELAVAGYLGTESMIFQETGICAREGILAAIQGNPINFRERVNLAAQVVNEAKRRGWAPNWQNSLAIEWDPQLQGEAVRVPGNIKARFFHIRVRNNHHHKAARNVYGYLVEVVNLDTNVPLPFESVEFKWAGYILPNATIAPGQYRKLDAFWLPHLQPTFPQFNAWTDSALGDFTPHFQGVGTWRLTYEVHSDNVPGARRSFRLQLDGTLDGVRFEPM
jgi:hypothetical protein